MLYFSLACLKLPFHLVQTGTSQEDTPSIFLLLTPKGKVFCLSNSLIYSLSTILNFASTQQTLIHDKDT